MHRAPMVNNHRAGRNRPHSRSLRIKSLVALDGIGLLGAAVQAVRQHAQQVRSGYVGHGPVIERAFRDRDPNAQFVIVEARFTKRLVLMPRRGMAAMAGLEYRVIAGEFGVRTQQLLGRVECNLAIRQLAQLACIHRGLQHAGRCLVPGTVRFRQIDVAALAAPLAAENHAHENLLAPFKLGSRDQRRPDHEKPLVEKLIDLFRSKRLFQGFKSGKRYFFHAKATLHSLTIFILFPCRRGTSRRQTITTVLWS